MCSGPENIPQGYHQGWALSPKFSKFFWNFSHHHKQPLSLHACRPKAWLQENINSYGRKAKFGIRTLKTFIRSGDINESLHKIKRQITVPQHHHQECAPSSGFPWFFCYFSFREADTLPQLNASWTLKTFLNIVTNNEQHSSSSWQAATPLKLIITSRKPPTAPRLWGTINFHVRNAKFRFSSTAKILEIQGSKWVCL